MTPKEKAIELVNKFNNIIPKECDGLENITSEFCALIAVNEILNIDNIKPYILHKEIIEYWENVKQEINKL